ncbi:MAG: DUF4190 domain-containing protein [Gammaproteobacteria bacterium]
MNLSDTEIQLLGALTILLCVPALVRTEVKGRSAWVLYYPIVPIVAYVLYEAAHIHEGEAIRRYDLFAVWPFLVWTISKTLYRWMQLSKTTEPPVTTNSELAVLAFLSGIVGFIRPYFVFFSVVALVCGHKAINDPTDFRGKKLAGLGLVAGYLGLIFGVIWALSN